MQTISELHEYLLTFMNSGAGVFVFVATCGVSTFLLLWLSSRKRKKDLTMEAGMNPEHFTMWISRGDSWGVIIGMLFWAVVFALIFFVGVDDRSSGMVFAGVLVLSSVFVSVLHSIYWKSWKLKIEGNRIYYTSLFRRKTVSFGEIKRVQGQYWSNRGTRRLHRIILYSETGRLFSVKVKSIGYSVLARRLKQHGIDVYVLRTEDDIAFSDDDDEEDDCAEDEDDDEFELDEYEDISFWKIFREELKQAGGLVGIFKHAWNRSFTFWWLQSVLLAVTLVSIVVVVFAADRWILSGADTALDILRGYLHWYWAFAGIFAVAVVVIILGNIIIARALTRTGDFAKRHAITAAVGILTVLVFVVWGAVYENLPALIRDAQSDIAAMEQGELLEADYHIHLDWENYYRTASLRDTGDYRPLYVVRVDELGHVYFPRSLSPAYLKERAADAVYQAPTHAGSRIFTIRYTPNFQVVVEAVPIRHDG